MKNLFSLEGKTVAVIGAGSGIGRAVAEGAAQQGAYVFCFDIKSDGALEAMINGEVVTGSAARLLADPGGRYLFMSNGFPGYIQPIAINTRTGRLTLVQGGLINSGNGTSLLTVVK